MKRRFFAAGIGCAAAIVVLAPATANAVPTGSADSGSAPTATGSAAVLPHLVEAAINCLVTGVPMQQCGYTGVDPAPWPTPVQG